MASGSGLFEKRTDSCGHLGVQLKLSFYVEYYGIKYVSHYLDRTLDCKLLIH